MKGLLVIWILFCVAIAGGSITLSLYGLYLAFSASVVLGLLALFIEPSPFIFGAVMFFMDKNIPEMLMEWLNK